MEEETRQPEGQVEADEMGIPQVSDSDLLDAVGLVDEDKEEAPPQKEEPKESPKPEIQKRKIKWQGQEVEVDPEKEVELLQKGYDYTQKMQALAAERELITPHIGVIKAMQQDPTLRQKIAEHFTGTPKVETPQFDDPIEQLKWETRQQTLKDVEEKFIKPMQMQQTQMTHQQVLANTRAQVQADPLFAEVHKAILDEVNSLPPSVQKTVYLQLDQDPKAYLETYQLKRQQLSAKKQTPMPEPTKREDHAPILESAKSAPSESELKKHNETLKSLNRRARSGDLRALGELLLKGDVMKGVID